MNTKWVTFVVAGLLTAGTAFAASDSNRPTQSTEDCVKLIYVTREMAENNDVAEKAQAEIDSETAENDNIAEKAQDKIDRLLVQLQTQCNDEQYEAADQTAEFIRGLVATE